NLLARAFPGRSGKQCRERWHNHVDERVKKGEWSAEEDQILCEAQRQLGNRWSEMSRILVGRSENAIKNRFNSLNAKGLTEQRANELMSKLGPEEKAEFLLKASVRSPSPSPLPPQPLQPLQPRPPSQAARRPSSSSSAGGNGNGNGSGSKSSKGGKVTVKAALSRIRNSCNASSAVNGSTGTSRFGDGGGGRGETYGGGGESGSSEMGFDDNGGSGGGGGGGGGGGSGTSAALQALMVAAQDERAAC
ncbi:unnamed protein product, partial [Hapterophycus canaliculatus]